MPQYYKVWFTNGKERTAKLVLSTDKYPLSGTSAGTYSRLFPISECMNMRRFCMTGLYNSFEEAFHERSKAQDLLLPIKDRFYK